MTDKLPKITFIRRYAKDPHVFYEIKLEPGTERLPIPVIMEVDGKNGIGVIFDLNEGESITLEDVTLLQRMATGYVFIFINTPDPESKKSDFVKELLMSNFGALDKMKAGEGFQSGIADFKPMTAEEAAEALKDLKTGMVDTNTPDQ